MSILDDISILDASVEQLSNTDGARKRADMIGRRLAKIHDLKKKALECAQSASLMRDEKLAYEDKTPLKGIALFCRKYGKTIADKNLDVLLDESFYTEGESLNTALSSLEMAMLAGWQRFAKPSHDPEQIESVAALFDDSKVQADFRRIASACREASRCAIRMPTSDKDLDAAKKSLEAIDDGLKQVEESGADSDVLEFLLTCLASGRVCLRDAMAKPSVKKWLSESAHAARFQISILGRRGW